jgi:hypothetical protein
MSQRPLTLLLAAAAVAALAGLAPGLAPHGHVHVFGQHLLRHDHFFVGDHQHPEESPEDPDGSDPDRRSTTISLSSPPLVAGVADALPGSAPAPRPSVPPPAAAVAAVDVYDPVRPRAPPA